VLDQAEHDLIADLVPWQRRKRKNELTAFIFSSSAILSLPPVNPAII